MLSALRSRPLLAEIWMTAQVYGTLRLCGGGPSSDRTHERASRRANTTNELEVFSRLVGLDLHIYSQAARTCAARETLEEEVSEMPGPGFEWIGKEEEKEVLEVLRSRWLFRYGDEKDPAFKRKVKTLEEMVEQRFGIKHALAVTSGTSALITALSALGIGPGDEVIVPGYTFIASISSIIIARAVPVLAEIDESLTLDPQDVERRITPRTKAIMAVHMLGNPCNLDALRAIARRTS